MADVTVRRLEEFDSSFGGAMKLVRHGLAPGVFARVGPGQPRKLLPGEQGARILAVGAMPGRAYEVWSVSVPQQS
jgi:hypothetical protein